VLRIATSGIHRGCAKIRALTAFTTCTFGSKIVEVRGARNRNAGGQTSLQLRRGAYLIVDELPRCEALKVLYSNVRLPGTGND
jgi:hypothetical protein